MFKPLRISISPDEAVRILNEIHVLHLVNGLTNIVCINIHGKCYYSASFVDSKGRNTQFYCRSEHQLFGRNLFWMREAIFVWEYTTARYEESGGGGFCSKVDELVNCLKKDLKK